jgi:GTP-binding protein
VITKSDKIKATELADVTARTVDSVRKRAAAHPEIIATSSEKGMGIPELRAAVLESTLR